MTDTGQVPAEGLPENDGLVEQPGMPAPGAYAFLDPAEGTRGRRRPAADAGRPGRLDGTAAGRGPVPARGRPVAAHRRRRSRRAGRRCRPDPGPRRGGRAAPGILRRRRPQPPHAAPVPPHHAAQHGAPSGADDLSDAHETGAHEAGGRDSGSVDLGAVRIPPPAPAAAAVHPPQPRRPLHMGPPMPEPTAGVVRSLADRGPRHDARTSRPSRRPRPRPRHTSRCRPRRRPRSSPSRRASS